MLDSIPARLLERARERPQAVAYRTRRGAQWHEVSWRDYAAQTRTVARALITLGLQADERVCILGYNRPEWVLFDIGAMMVGAVPAGIYTTCSAEEVGYIIGHAKARLVLVENASQLEKVKAEWSDLPDLTHVILMDGDDDDPRVLSWSAFTEGATATDEEVDERLKALRDDGLATLIYTSGTTGPPKGVMLTHLNLSFTADTTTLLADADESDRMISYLPLSHIAEQLFTIHGALTAGYAVSYARSLETLLEDINDVQPTILFAVPRVWEKMHAKLSARLNEATGLRGAIASWAMGVGVRRVDAYNHGRTLGLFGRLQYRVAKRLLFSKVKARLGLEDLRYGISGAAPISADILRFFSGLDIPILEVYGQSEDTGPTTFNRPGATRFGTVGTPIPMTEVRIADDGEILVKGQHVCAGYLDDPGATAATIQDGWLHSGDLGSFDDEGFLRITGRKKEIIITAGGKNIAPANIEAALKDLPLVSQAVLIGERRRFVSALITLDLEAVEALVGRVSDPHSHAEVLAALQQGIDDEVNTRFARVEHVRKFTVLPRDLSIEDGELTPTMKVKRRVVDEHFADLIEAMYAQ